MLWAITKGSFINKLIILPIAFLLSAFLPQAVIVLLLLGGLYLAYEGAEKIYEFVVPHQHEEIQVSYIAEGEGTLVVGDTVNHYKKGDVLVIGSKLPHVFKSEVNTNKKSLMLSLFFTESSFGKHFFKLEELSQQFNISRERVRQIEEKAIEKLQKEISNIT